MVIVEFAFVAVKTYLWQKLFTLLKKMSMKLFKRIAFAAILAVGASSAAFYTSCNKDKCKDVTCQNGGTCSDGNCTCMTGYYGTTCDSSYRNLYVGTYKGNGVDNATPSNTYTDWRLVFTNVGTTVTTMQVVLQDNTTAPVVSLPITLSTIATSASGNTVFTITSTSSGGYTYTGTGTVSNTIASITLTETNNTTSMVTVYTFTNMAKQ